MAVSTIDSTGLTNNTITATQLATAVQPLGVGQTWQNVAASRALGTTYTNSTGRPIAVSVQVQATTNGTTSIIVSGVTVNSTVAQANLGVASFAIIPTGATYVVDNNQASKSILYWAELF
jgi:hypothetical protein